MTIKKLASDLDEKIKDSEETAMMKVHEALETVLRDTFKVEDGHRLSSMQSLQASQATLDTLLEEFSQHVA